MNADSMKQGTAKAEWTEAMSIIRQAELLAEAARDRGQDDLHDNMMIHLDAAYAHLELGEYNQAKHEASKVFQM